MPPFSPALNKCLVLDSSPGRGAGTIDKTIYVIMNDIGVVPCILIMSCSLSHIKGSRAAFLILIQQNDTGVVPCILIISIFPIDYNLYSILGLVCLF